MVSPRPLHAHSSGPANEPGWLRALNSFERDVLRLLGVRYALAQQKRTGTVAAMRTSARSFGLL